MNIKLPLIGLLGTSLVYSAAVDAQPSQAKSERRIPVDGFNKLKPGASSVCLDPCPDDPKAAIRIRAVFQLTLFSKDGRFNYCTGLATTGTGAEVTLLTAAHCMIVDKSIARRIRIRRTNQTPIEKEFTIPPEDISFESKRVADWVKDPKGRSLSDVLYPVPDVERWESDIVRVRLDPHAWPTTWHALPAVAAAPLSAEEHVTVTGGGCSQAAPDCDVSAYRLFADDSFVARSMYSRLFTVETDTSQGAGVRFGDSGGPVFKLVENKLRLVGIVSASLAGTTYIQRTL